MIRLRLMLERGRKHPLLGPVVLLLLVLLLAMTCFHAAQDGWEAAAGTSVACIGLITLLGVVVSQLLPSRAISIVLRYHAQRAPPEGRRGSTPAAHARPLLISLRR